VKPGSIQGEDQVPEEYAVSIILKMEAVCSSARWYTSTRLNDITAHKSTSQRTTKNLIEN
jgi:hypothetical protein